jgi:hypothetical protein
MQPHHVALERLMVVFSVTIHALNFSCLGIWDFKSFFKFFWEGVNSLLSRKEQFKFHGIMGLRLRGYAISTTEMLLSASWTVCICHLVICHRASKSYRNLVSISVSHMSVPWRSLISPTFLVVFLSLGHA